MHIVEVFGRIFISLLFIFEGIRKIFNPDMGMMYMAKRDMGFIARSAFPLFLLMILAVIIIIAFPQLALWLPEQMIQPLN